MRKICFFLTCFIIYISNYTVYAKQEIAVGLTRYTNVHNIKINNKHLMFSDNTHFYQNNALSSINGFEIKIITGYSIKLNGTFNTYSDALNNANSPDYIIYENGYYYILSNNFEDKQTAKNYISSNSIDGIPYDMYNFIGIYIDDILSVAFDSFVNIKPKDGNIIIDNKEYRNLLKINSKNNKLTTINILDVEQYLYGVVPTEMPTSWHIEALKAQAVSARNYAFINKGIHINDGFDICDTVHCQVYNGTQNENTTTTRAVDETSGIYAYYDDEIINSVYFSSSGGYTDNSENVWNEAIPYLKAINDSQEQGAKIWNRKITFQELSDATSIGNITEIILVHSSTTSRVNSIELIGITDTKILEKESIRTFFNTVGKGKSLPSRNFKMINGNDFEINGIKTLSNDVFIQSSTGNVKLNLNNIKIINNNNIINEIITDDAFVITNQNKVTKLSNNDLSSTNELVYSSKLTSNTTNTIVFSGTGFGHGVGMSQFGANTLAKNGYKYDEILKFYYTGINVR